MTSTPFTSPAQTTTQRKLFVAAALALAGTLATGAAMARSDVQWSVTIGAPFYGPPVRVYEPAPVYYPAPVYRPAPVYAQPAPVYRPYPSHSQWDRDGDGIPNRHDRVYNPRWDRDGDGIPNRQDRVYNPRWDRDGDGVPNRYDRNDNRYGRGR